MESNQNYFFVVQDLDHTNLATAYAQGDGLQTAEAIARLALVSANALGELSLVGASSGVSLASDLAAYHRERPAELQFRHSFNARVLSRIIRSSFDQDLEARLIEQVTNGARSPQSVVDQIEQQGRDEAQVRSVSDHWYDSLGRQIAPPDAWTGRYGDSNDENLVLGVVRRSSQCARIKPSTKEALYDVVPPGSRVRVNRVLPLSTLGRRDTNTDDWLVGHKTFGYLQDRRFIPVVTELAWNHT